MQQLGWLDFLTRPLWHTGGIVSEGSTLGDIAHSFVGYADSPTLLQVLVYVGYLGTVLFFFLRASRAKAPVAQSVSAPSSPAPASSTQASPTPAS
jgi:high-affinity iron transporter